MADDLLRKTEIETAAGGRGRAGPRIGLALGAGAARGWAHIGALHELKAMGLVPDVVVGSSIGALVGGCFAAGRLDELESFARSLNKRRVFGLLDFSFSGAGLIGGDRLRVKLQESIGAMRIEDLPMRFAGVATELDTGHEVWLRRGSLVDAIRASYALPGVFEPVRLGRRWLIDGAVVNPVPVSVARALGAERVVALSITVDGTGRGATRHDGIEADLAEDEAPPAARRGAGLLRRGRSGASAPGLASVMANAFNITQDRLMRSRLAGDPPDVLINLKVGRIGVFEFDRAEELIALGREAVRRARDDIAECFDLAPAAEG
ncbi:MAG: patatin-like phospholipase family protein [Roseiarcus sp.]|jgi:NTE family protein|uniref:patatin-like phospholipase family protein n=1 Tax=Roseiarcus sp. TaxID=1969460 RepID=UPI003C1AD094